VITYDSAATFQSLGYAGGLEDRATGLVRFGARDDDVGSRTLASRIVLGLPHRRRYGISSVFRRT